MERSPKHEQLENNKSLFEIINPKNLPESAFQSYQYLANNAPELREGFKAGEFRNPPLEHPKLDDTSELDAGMARLDAAMAELEQADAPAEFIEATKFTLEFRKAEMEYVKLLAQIQHETDPARRAELAELTANLNAELYGVPDERVRDAALNQIWGRIEGKDLSESATKIYNELVDGVEFNGEKLPGLMRAADKEAKLPQFANNEALNWASEKVIEANADIQALIEAWWEDKTQQFGDDYVAEPVDIAEAFDLVIKMRDPDGKSGVQAILAEGKTALSWESSEMAVNIGTKRAPIKNAEDLFKKVLHEYGVHGQRAVNGLKTGLPVLGTGLYTNSVRPDYLTFEEGFATTVEEMVGDSEPDWTIAKLAHYINASIVHSTGTDFRGVYENAWRTRLLYEIKDGQDVTDEMIDKAKTLAYNNCVRIFRGQPEATGNYFGKDLAYTNGRFLAMEYLEKIYENKDEAEIKRLFAAKFDPTNPDQDTIVRMALGDK